VTAEPDTPLPALARRAGRVRLPSIKSVESGKTVIALTVAPDGSKRFEFGQLCAPKSAINPWDMIYSETDQKRPS
jgi:hypothetical protein